MGTGFKPRHPLGPRGGFRNGWPPAGCRHHCSVVTEPSVVEKSQPGSGDFRARYRGHERRRRGCIGTVDVREEGSSGLPPTITRQPGGRDVRIGGVRRRRHWRTMAATTAKRPSEAPIKTEATIKAVPKICCHTPDFASCRQLPRSVRRPLVSRRFAAVSPILPPITD
jgi:hypothetical protein